MLPPRSNSSTSTTAFTSSGHLRQPTPVFSPRGEAPACNHQQQSPSPTNTDASSPGRSTSSTSATASPSSSHHRQPTLMFPPGEAPARRAPLHPAVAVTLANQRRCFIPEGKHQLDEYHCITRQYSPSPTNTDASSPRRSTSSTSTTASPSSSHLRQPTPMLASRGEAPARRAPLHPPAAVTFANQRRCFLPEAEHPLGEPHCITQQQSPSS